MSLLKRAVKSGLSRLGYDVRLNSAQRTPLLGFVTQQLEELERSVDGSTSRADLFKKLPALSLSDFGLLMLSMPDPQFPRISALLPRMATDEIQKSWTGTSGEALLTQTLDFVRSLAYNFARVTGHTLDGATVLDFGCGYGRIARLMYYFTQEDRFYGVDPWDRSIEICHADGLNTNFLLSDYLPATLPVVPNQFDLIYAFSVFTHLSERATLACLNTLTNYVRPDGMIAITIRPVEYWNVDANARRSGSVEKQIEEHRLRGLSFLPHDRPAVDGEVTYGDTSLSLDWLIQSFPQLKVAGTDRSLADPYQIYVFLQKR